MHGSNSHSSIGSSEWYRGCSMSPIVPFWEIWSRGVGARDLLQGPCRCQEVHAWELDQGSLALEVARGGRLSLFYTYRNLETRWDTNHFPNLHGDMLIRVIELTDSQFSFFEPAKNMTIKTEYENMYIRDLINKSCMFWRIALSSILNHSPLPLCIGSIFPSCRYRPRRFLRSHNIRNFWDSIAAYTFPTSGGTKRN